MRCLEFLVLWAILINADEQPPHLYCEDPSCRDMMLPYRSYQSKGDYYVSGNISVLIPRKGYSINCSGVGIASYPKNATGAVFSHGYCIGVTHRICDAIVANSTEAVVKLLEDSTGHYPYIQPTNISDFNATGCLDIMGYKYDRVHGRPRTCFSLIAISPESRTIYSGRLHLNDLPIEGSLLTFLVNVNETNYDIANDLVCTEIYNEATIEDYCYRVVYPAVHYRICCCYNEADASLCHVHPNPLNKPAVAKARYRCLIGDFDSGAQAAIRLLMSTQADELKTLAEFCSIRYELTTHGSQMWYKYVQEKGEGSYEDYLNRFWPNGNYNESQIPHPSLKFWMNDTYCHVNVANPAQCPIATEEDKLLNLYNITCVCNFDYCNYDRVHQQVQSLLADWDKRCVGGASFIETIRQSQDVNKCFYYQDPWTETIFDVLSSGAIRTGRPQEMAIVLAKDTLFNWAKNVTVFRREYRMPNNCMEPDLPIRTFFFIECHPPTNRGSNCSDDWYVLFPECKQNMVSNVAGIEGLMKFVGNGNRSEANTTARCYAQAELGISFSHKNITLQSGPVDDWTPELRSICLDHTETEDCYSHHVDNFVYMCCYYTEDVQQKLYEKIKPMVIATSPEEIRPYIEELPKRRICILSYSSGNETAQGECIRKDDVIKTTTYPLYEYCLLHQNIRQCGVVSSLKKHGDFCCCGDTLEGCSLGNIGKNRTNFLSHDVYAN